MTDLRPPALNEQGLEPALRDLAASFRRRTGLECPVAVATTRRMTPEAETVLYRVVQEALTNVANHARAGRARVELIDAPDGEGVDLTIDDDGVGFALEDMPSFVAGGHFGLAGMRERAELTSGRFTVTSTPGGGTRTRSGCRRPTARWRCHDRTSVVGSQFRHVGVPAGGAAGRRGGHLRRSRSCARSSSTTWTRSATG